MTDPWHDTAGELETALAVIDAALANRDWNRLAGAAWQPPAVAGAPGVAARGQLAGLAVKLAELRSKVEADLAGVEAELAELADRRRAGRAYRAS